MFKKIITTTLLVCGVFSKSSFIGDVKRAELFELTDNEVAVFRVTLPDDEFLQLKEEVQMGMRPPYMGGFGGRQPPPNGMGGFGGMPPPPDGMGGFGGMPPPPDSMGGMGGFGGMPPPPDGMGGMGGFGGMPPPPDGMGGFGGMPPSSDGMGGFGGMPPPPDGMGGMGGFGGMPPPNGMPQIQNGTLYNPLPFTPFAVQQTETGTIYIPLQPIPIGMAPNGTVYYTQPPNLNSTSSFPLLTPQNGTLYSPLPPPSNSMGGFDATQAQNGNFFMPPPPNGMGGMGGMPPQNGMGGMGGMPPQNGMGGMGGMGGPPPMFGDDDSFKTKNATMIVELKGKEKSFDKVTFAIGGSSSRMFCKQGFNLKIRGNEDLYGRINLRLRPDAREATFLRSKLVCDMHNRLGLPSISANYATLYINDEFMGFYVLLDAFKLSWVEFEYDDKNSTTLYQCKDMSNLLTVQSSSNRCTNENDEVTDHSEWIELLTRLDAAQSDEDIEDIFDVDQFLTEIAYEYLSGSWDHYLNFGHNFYMYKPKNDKWKMMLYDFDGELGQDASMGAGGGPGGRFSGAMNKTVNDIPSYSFAEWTKSRHLIDILVLNNSTRFDNILRNFVRKAFNPTVLFPHIDELKEFIRPYVELDKTPDENGKYPGRLNENKSDYTLAQWEANSEFTNIRGAQGGGQSFGLKYWILAKYRYVCKAYNMDDCDPVYLDENYEIPIDKEVEATSEMMSGGPPRNWGNGNGWPQPQPQGNPVVQPPATTTAVQPPATTTVVQPSTTTEVSQYSCWVEVIGRPCCPSNVTKVYYQDANGDWGYDFDANTWCGLTPYVEPAQEECWSKSLGYSCCKGCKVYETDENGDWGYENKQWCGIPSYCPIH